MLGEFAAELEDQDTSPVVWHALAVSYSGWQFWQEYLNGQDELLGKRLESKR